MVSNKIQVLSNPPVQEAVIQLDFKDTGIEFVDLQEFFQVIKEKFPQAKERVDFQMKISSASIEESSSNRTGIMASNPDEKKAMVISGNTFSFHFIEPYSGWDNFIEEFNENWDKFNSYFKKKEIKLRKVSLRYINKIKIDLPMKNGFEDHIKLMINIPDELPNAIDGYFSQISLPKESNGLKSTITSAIESVDKRVLNFLFDIKVYKEFDDNNKLNETLESLRAYKNDIFFMSLTDSEIEKYK